MFEALTERIIVEVPERSWLVIIYVRWLIVDCAATLQRVVVNVVILVN
jgi:hypothetical protein